MSARWKVSAIVSAYKSERFLRGCLDDLEAQTIANHLEIVVINSGSPQCEDEIVSEYTRRYDNIVYVRTPWREGVYAAWNRGVLMSSGQYLTNANTDDRHRKDALGVLSTALDENRKAVLAYGGYLVTHAENETFEKNTATETHMPVAYKRSMMRCFPGPQPMWRRSLHTRYGLFDERYQSAGDFEFWMRVSGRRRSRLWSAGGSRQRFLLVPEVLGLYFNSPDSVEHSNPNAQAEAEAIVRLYRW